MVKLLLVTKLFEPVTGGVETAVGAIASAFGSNNNFVVTILAGNEKPFTGTHRYQWKNVTVIKSASAGVLHNTAVSPVYFRLLWLLIKENDIIHFHTPNPLGTFAQFFLNIPAAKKVIASVHADVGLTKKSRYGAFYNSLLKKLLTRANVITTTSPQNLEIFPVLNTFQHKCSVIPLALDPANTVDVSAEEIAAFQKKYLQNSLLSKILFVGRLDEDKGLTYLIEAVKQIKDVQLVITGDGPLLSSLQKQAAPAGDERIVFTGYLRGRDLACAYRSAKLFVLPSVKETFGIVQAEAMFVGLPVINTQLGTGTNFVSINNQTGFTVPASNGKALVEAIKEILGNPRLYQQFSDNAKQRSALFTPEKMVAAFEKLYH
jgi:rhamnosyl/mannosyltransferase